MKFTLTTPYVEVSPLKFGMTEAEAISILGSPEMRLLTKKRDVDLRYPFGSLCFSGSTDKLAEIMFFPTAEITIEGINLFLNPEFYQVLIRKDGSALEYVGVLFLPHYGIGLTGFHDDNPSERSVAAYTGGRLDHLLKNFKPFELSD